MKDKFIRIQYFKTTSAEDPMPHPPPGPPNRPIPAPTKR
jgi:hypothetical protein